MNCGGVPEPGFGYAYTCTTSTPSPEAAAASSAQPAIMNGCLTTVPFAGVSMTIAGRAGALGGAGDGVGAGAGTGSGVDAAVVNSQVSPACTCSAIVRATIRQ